MKKTLVSLVLLLVLSTTAWAQNKEYDKEFEVAMREMFEVSKAMETMKQVAPQVAAMIVQQVPDAPQALLDDLKQMQIDLFEKLITELIPVYQKHLTLKDIKGVIKFYKSPLGQKFAVSSGVIALEVMPIAQKVASDEMAEFMKKAKEKGYL